MEDTHVAVPDNHEDDVPVTKSVNTMTGSELWIFHTTLPDGDYLPDPGSGGCC